MDVLDCINTRRSIRKFMDLPVPWENVIDILDAGRMTPSAGNLQNWKFVLFTDPGQREAIAEACLQQYWIATAPLVIVVVADPHKAKQYYGKRGEMMYTIQNCAAATMNMLLAAHDIGLGACWVSAFDDDMLSRAVGTPGSVVIQAVIPVGYPDEEPPEIPRHDLVVNTRFGGFGNTFIDPVDASREYSIMVKRALEKGKAKWKKLKDKIQDVK